MTKANHYTSENLILAQYIELRMKEERLSKGDLHGKSAVAKTTINRILDPHDDYTPQQKTIRALLNALDESLDGYRAFKEKIATDTPPLEEARFATPEPSDEDHTGEIPPILVGWVRMDVVRFCRKGERKNKPYLATRFINYGKMVVMTDFLRHVGEDISATAKLVPVIRPDERIVNTLNAPKKSKNLRVLTGKDAEAWELSAALDSLEYEGACPHCKATYNYTCGVCDTTICDEEFGGYDPVCISCGATTPREEIVDLSYALKPGKAGRVDP